MRTFYRSSLQIIPARGDYRPGSVKVAARGRFPIRSTVMDLSRAPRRAVESPRRAVESPRRAVESPRRGARLESFAPGLLRAAITSGAGALIATAPVLAPDDHARAR
jgi:hypothetical protein